MKKIIILSLLILTSCQSFYINKAIKPENRMFEEKLPYLETIFESESSIKSWNKSDNLVKVNTTYANLFYREVEKNLIEPGDESTGYIVLTPIFHTNEIHGAGYTVLSAVTLFTVNLLGVPFSKRYSFCELEARILNKDGKIIKKYSSESSVEKYVAMYWGYSETGAMNAALYTSYKDSLSDIISQINDDTQMLNKKLKN